MLRSAPLRLAMLLALALLAPATALAQAPAAVEIDGAPLNIFADVNGSIQTNVDGYSVSEFYPPNGPSGPDGSPQPNQTANAGFGILVTDPANPNSFPVYYSKFGGQPMPNGEGPTLAPGNPATLTSAWTIPDSNGAPLLRITQVLTYTNGSRQFDGRFTVQNLTGNTVPFRASVGGDLAIRGSDTGVGFDAPGPPRFLGGVNPEVGAAGGYVQDTPWSHWQVGGYSIVSSNLANSSGGLDDTVTTDSVDNGAGVTWDNFRSPGLGPNASAEFRVGFRFVDTLGLDPPSATEQTGAEHVVKASLKDINGAPKASQPLNWQVDGANPATGAVTTDANGNATISWIGGSPGDDVLTVFQDTNKNGIRDLNETQATAQVTWVGPQPPIPGTTVNVRTEKGTVKIQLPKGTTAKRAKALGAPVAAVGKFTVLKSNTSIPVGSLLDTSKGTVRLLSAGKPKKNASSFQGVSLHGGQFGVNQKGSNPLTDLAMKSGNLGGCKTRVPKGGARKIAVESRRRGRSLFGNGKGRFRTRGRNSSATVRGTKWLVKDSCAGTLTTVSRGTVVVRDFTKRKNITLKASGKHKRTRYFARPPKH